MFENSKEHLGATVLSLAALSFAFTGCTVGDPPHTTPASPPSNAPKSVPTAVLRSRGERGVPVKVSPPPIAEDWGNGVWTFRATEQFPAQLSQFRKEHSDLEIIAVTQGVDKNQSLGNSSWGGSDSFVVVTKEK